MSASKDNSFIDFDDMTPPQFLHAARKAVQKTRGDPSRSRATLAALIEWVDNNPVRFAAESAMGKIVDLIMRFDDDDDLNDEDIIAFMKLLGGFFRVVTAKDFTDAENWELKTNMSPNLLMLFGGISAPSKNDGTATDWIAPSKSGMGNSDALIPTDENSYKEAGNPIPISRRAEAKQGESRSNRRSSKSSSHGDEDDDDEFDYGDGDEDEGSGAPVGTYVPPLNSIVKCCLAGLIMIPSNVSMQSASPHHYLTIPPIAPIAAMSLNLMKALGLDTTGMKCETDWTPPESIGIDAIKIEAN